MKPALSLVVFVLGWWIGSIPVEAALSCSGSVSPSSVAAGSEARFRFSFTNTGDQVINWVQISRPSDLFQLINYGISGWSVGCAPDYCDVWDGSIAAGEEKTFEFGVRTSEQETSSANWWLGASSGGGLVQCGGGPFGTAISGLADTTAPILSEPSITGVSSSTVTIGWTADEPSRGYFRYGKGYEVYEASLESTDLKTSHSFTLTGLAVNTTYYFEYRGEDADGNSTPWWNYYTFTTSGVTEVTQPQIIRIETPAPRVEQPKPEIVTVLVRDREPPRVRLTSTLEPFYDAYPEIELLATDNTVVAAVEYSVDGGKSWRPVTLAGQRASERLSVQLPLVVEGDYRVYVRAFDAERNRGTAGPFTVVMLTNLSGERDAEEAILKGAVKYIVKSEYDPQQVVKMVNEILAGYVREGVPGS